MKAYGLQKPVRYSSWSKIRYLLHTSGCCRHFVRCSSRIRYSGLRYSSRRLYYKSSQSQADTA